MWVLFSFLMGVSCGMTISSAIASAHYRTLDRKAMDKDI